MEDQLYTGKVKKFKNGFGFISRDDKAADVFVHYSNINGKGYKNLEVGDRVSFTLGLGPKELIEAKEVKVVPAIQSNTFSWSATLQKEEVAEDGSITIRNIPLGPPDTISRILTTEL